MSLDESNRETYGGLLNTSPVSASSPHPRADDNMDCSQSPTSDEGSNRSRNVQNGSEQYPPGQSTQIAANGLYMNLQELDTMKDGEDLTTSCVAIGADCLIRASKTKFSADTKVHDPDCVTSILVHAATQLLRSYFRKISGSINFDLPKAASRKDLRNARFSSQQVIVLNDGMTRGREDHDFGRGLATHNSIA